MTPETYLLSTPAIFDFSRCLRYLGRSPLELLHRVEDNRLYKLLRLDGQLVLLAIESGEGNTLRLSFLNHTPTPAAISEATLYLEQWFDLKRDLSGFYTLAESDALLAKTLPTCSGLRLIGVNDLFEALCWAITGQQINLTFAYTLKGRLVQNFGEKLQHAGHDYWLFPTPQRIAALTPDGLRIHQFSGKKSEYLINIARLIAEGSLSQHGLLALGDFRGAEATLVSIHGIGAWTANYVLMRCLRDPAAFPIADVGLHNAIKYQLQMDRKPTIPEIQQMAANWGNWKAYATFYLWNTLY